MEATIQKGRKPPVRDDTHTTPPEVYGPLEALGGVGLDPCGHPSNIYARHTYLLPEYADKTSPSDYKRVTFGDGLEAPWNGHGVVFGNIPFSHIPPWTFKAAREGDEVVLLMPARMNAVHLHENAFRPGLVGGADAVHFPLRRVKFRNATTQPPWHVMLLYYGSRWELFADAYKHNGITLPFQSMFPRRATT